MDREDLLEDLKSQLQFAKNDLEAAESKIDEDEDLIASLEGRLQALQAELDRTREKLIDLEKSSQSHTANIPGQNEDLQERIALDKQVKDLSHEVAELRAQNQELTFQQERNNTRSKIKSINEDKQNKEEQQRLQKEVRKAEQALKMATSTYEAQLKASQDKNDRLLEKIKVATSRFDELDKERLELKLENSRLQNKLEKSGSFIEMKRIQTVQETVQMELDTLKRKNIKLEEDLANSGGERNSSVQNQKRELTKLKEENKILVEKNESLEQTSEVFALKVKQLDSHLAAEKARTIKSEAELEKLKKLSNLSQEDYIADLHQQIEALKTRLVDIETNFKVKEKDLWLTIEAQKKTIEELEIAKLKLELGEDEEVDDHGGIEKSTEVQSSEENQRLMAENEKMREELQTVDDQQALLEEKLEELSSANSSLENTLKERTSEGELLKNKLVSCQEELYASSLQEEKLVKELDEAKDICKQAPSIEEYKKLKQQLENLVVPAKDVEDDKLASMKEELARLTAINSRLMQDLEAAEEDAGQMEESVLENTRLHAEIAKLEEQNKEIRNDLENAEDELERLDAEMEKQTKLLMEEIDYIKTNKVFAILV